MLLLMFTVFSFSLKFTTPKFYKTFLETESESTGN